MVTNNDVQIRVEGRLVRLIQNGAAVGWAVIDGDLVHEVQVRDRVKFGDGREKYGGNLTALHLGELCVLERDASSVPPVIFGKTVGA